MRAKENTLWRNKTRSSPAQDVKPKHHEHRQQETLRDVSRKPSLVFIKASKVGGSTVGGVARRIGEQFGLSGTRDRNWISSEPGVWANHREYARVQGRLSRLKGRRFVFAWVRNPVDRCLSAFYHFAVSRNGKEPTDDAIIQHARGCKNDVSKYIGLRRDKGAAEIMAHYDFLGMTERFEDSMLLLRHKLAPLLGHIRLGDILYLKSKDSNAGPGVKDDIGAVFVPRKPLAQQSPRVRAFFDSAEFKENNARDWDLWRTVNATVDQEINQLLSAETRAEYHKMLTDAKSKCRKFMEEKRDCFWNDNGCGISCLDSVAGHDFVRSSGRGEGNRQTRKRLMK